MIAINKRYWFTVFFLGLITTTYLGFGEAYLLSVTLLLGVLRFRKTVSIHKIGRFEGFIAYYLLVSLCGLITNYVGMKNIIEFLIKYICLPTIISFLIPNKYYERIKMLQGLKIIIFLSAVYGLVESLLKYNFLVDFIGINARIWMETMNYTINYQPCSFFLHYNYYGCILVLGIILGKYIPYKNKIINTIYWGILLEQLLICQSRICWIATIVFLIIEIMQSKSITVKKLKKFLVVVLGITCVLIFEPNFFVTLGKFIGNRFSRLWVYGFADGSLGQRLGTLLNWPEYFINNPIAGIFGTGYQSISVDFMKTYSFFENYSTADCQLTVYLVETGLIGIIIFSSAIFQFFKQSRGLRYEEAIVIRIGKLGVIAYLVEGFTLDIVANNIMLSLLFLVLLVGKKKE